MSLGSTPQRCITSPAITKKGMARSGNESMPENIRVGRTAMGTTPDSTMNARPPSPRQKAIGTPRNMVSANTATSTPMSIGDQISAAGGVVGTGSSKPSNRATMTKAMRPEPTGMAR